MGLHIYLKEWGVFLIAFAAVFSCQTKIVVPDTQNFTEDEREVGRMRPQNVRYPRKKGSTGLNSHSTI